MEVRVSVSDAQGALADCFVYAYQKVLTLMLPLLHVQHLTGLLDMIHLNSPYCCHQLAVHTL